MCASTVPQCAPALSAAPLNVTGRRGSRRDDGAAYHHAAALKTSLTDPWLRPLVIVPPLASVRRVKTTLEQRAYSTWQLDTHEIVNDVFEGRLGTAWSGVPSDGEKYFPTDAQESSPFSVETLYGS